MIKLRNCYRELLENVFTGDNHAMKELHGYIDINREEAKEMVR